MTHPRRFPDDNDKWEPDSPRVRRIVDQHAKSVAVAWWVITLALLLAIFFIGQYR